MDTFIFAEPLLQCVIYLDIVLLYVLGATSKKTFDTKSKDVISERSDMFNVLSISNDIVKKNINSWLGILTTKTLCAVCF